MGLSRDVVAYITKVALSERSTSVDFWLRELAGALGMRWYGETTADALCSALDVARMMTVRNMPVRQLVTPPRKKGQKKPPEPGYLVVRVTFGFLDSWGRVVEYEKKIIPKNRQWCVAYLSRIYSEIIKKLPLAPVPAKAIEAANAAPPRVRGAAKNLAYYLASRVPSQKVRLLLPTMRDICHIDGYRWPSEIRKAMENTMQVLHPTIIRDYNYYQEGYDIILAGSLSTKNLPGGTNLTSDN
jgi:hypothetical protein